MSESKYFKILIISLLSISFYIALRNITFFHSALINFLYVIFPLIIGLIFTFLNNILLVKFEKKFKNRKICISLTVFTIFLFIAVFVFLILPELKNAVLTLIQNFPSYISRLNRFGNILNKRFGFTLPELSETDLFSKINPNGIWHTVSEIVSLSANMIIGFILSIYILYEKENFIDISKKATKIIFKKHSASLFKLSYVSNIIFTNYITGQFIEALILGILTFFGMLIFRFPYSVMISGVICITALIPVFGAIIGGTVGFLLILSESLTKAVWFIVFLIVLQQAEGNIIYPKVMGKSVGLPSSVILIAVTLGFRTAGFAGALLSVPTASVIYYYIWEHKNKQ